MKTNKYNRGNVTDQTHGVASYLDDRLFPGAIWNCSPEKRDGWLCLGRVETEKNLEIVVVILHELHAGLQLSCKSSSKFQGDEYKKMKGAENISVHSTCQTASDMLCHCGSCAPPR